MSKHSAYILKFNAVAKHISSKRMAGKMRVESGRDAAGNADVVQRAIIDSID